MKSLVIITARGGSKGIPYKNIKLLGGKPLIYYSIDVARTIVPDAQICVSTDDDAIIQCVEDYGLAVPFRRPAYLASDTCGSYEVLLHALSFYENRGDQYDNIILLQPTSPFRTSEQVMEALSLYHPEIDMVVSVKAASANPYYDCFEETSEGFLHISKGDGMIIRRQNAPQVWESNGAIYIINPDSLKKSPLGSFKKRIKYVMDDLHSVDLDTMFDWTLAEFIIKEKLL